MSCYAYLLLVMVLIPVAAAAIWHLTGYLFFSEIEPDPHLAFRERWG